MYQHVIFSESHKKYWSENGLKNNNRLGYYSNMVKHKIWPIYCNEIGVVEYFCPLTVYQSRIYNEPGQSVYKPSGHIAIGAEPGGAGGP